MERKNDVRIISVQFSFSNPKVVLSALKQRKDETVQENARRRLKNEHGDGYVIIKPTENCSLSKLPDELRMTGYKLVDAFEQKRPKSGRPYRIARFLFSREEQAAKLEFERKMRKDVACFIYLCNSALWRAKAFSNLFYGDGGAPTGERVVNIVLGTRQPLFHPDGTPVTVWQKGEDGERVGDGPRPLSAEYYLRIKEVVADVALTATESAD